MSKPTTREMLQGLDIAFDGWIRSCLDTAEKQRVRWLWHAICCLIEKFAKWQEKADVINVDFFGAPSMNLRDAHDLILEIRDFRKEEK